MADSNPAVSLDGKGALCVSIHDVAPETWAECVQLAQAVREVADIPLTWLVVPEFHGHGGRSREFEDGLGHMLARGDELVLHGFTHLDETPGHGGVVDWLLRRGYTQGEGEFAAIGEDEALRKITQGLDWFHERGWPVSGFVAPAWLLGPGAWRAVQASPFLYTTTFSRFYLLKQDAGIASGQMSPECLPSGLVPPEHLPSSRFSSSVFSPSLVYAARNRIGRALSPYVADMLSCLPRALTPGSERTTLTRLALHPRDARYPRLVRHAQLLVGRMLATREPMTKASFARILAANVQNPGRIT